MIRRFTLPEELTHSLFFSEDTVFINQEERLQWKGDVEYIRFPYEVLYYHNIEASRPWEEPHEAIEWMFTEWRKISGESAQCFAERNLQEALPFMKAGISLFLTCLFWMNHHPVHLKNWQEQMDKLSNHPLNIKERATFILLRPGHYSSYIQLKELMTEIEKQFYKLAALQKAVKKRIKE